MRFLSVAAALVVALVSFSIASAEELKSGIEVDGKIGPYRTVKVAGSEDGVEAGDSLCYTCRLGARPVAFVFAKKPNDALATLIKQLDEIAAKNADAKMANVVNFSGEVSDEYVQQIKQFGEDLDLKHTALTTSADGGKFKVNEDAEVTVMHYKGKKVTYNFASKEELDEDDVQQIVKGAGTIVD